MREAIYFTVRLLLASMFLVAASSKFLNTWSLARTLSALGPPMTLAKVLAKLVVMLELGVFLALVGGAGAAPEFAVLLVTAVGFVAVGVRALGLQEPIPCSCFSTYSHGRLGWKQVTLGVVLAALAVVARLDGAQHDLDRSIVLAASASTLACLAQIVVGYRAFAEGVGYRLAVRR